MGGVGGWGSPSSSWCNVWRWCISASWRLLVSSMAYPLPMRLPRRSWRWKPRNAWISERLAFMGRPTAPHINPRQSGEMDRVNISKRSQRYEWKDMKKANLFQSKLQNSSYLYIFIYKYINTYFSRGSPKKSGEPKVPKRFLIFPWVWLL